IKLDGHVLLIDVPDQFGILERGRLHLLALRAPLGGEIEQERLARFLGFLAGFGVVEAPADIFGLARRRRRRPATNDRQQAQKADEVSALADGAGIAPLAGYLSLVACRPKNHGIPMPLLVPPQGLALSRPAGALAGSFLAAGWWS